MPNSLQLGLIPQISECPYPYAASCYSEKSFNLDPLPQYSFANDFIKYPWHLIMISEQHQNLIPHFITAFKNITIAESFNNSNLQYQFKSSDHYTVENFISGKGHSCTIRMEYTAEKEASFLFEWAENNALSDRSNKKLPTLLYISDRETIFVPAPKNQDQDIAFYRGMRHLYNSIRKTCSYELARSIADHPLSVRTIGENSYDELNLPKKDVYYELTNEKFSIYTMKVFYKNGTYTHIKHNTMSHFGFFSNAYNWLKNAIYDTKPTENSISFKK